MHLWTGNELSMIRSVHCAIGDLLDGASNPDIGGTLDEYLNQQQPLRLGGALTKFDASDS
jgi:hypothetical protein